MQMKDHQVLFLLDNVPYYIINKVELKYTTVQFFLLNTISKI